MRVFRTQNATSPKDNVGIIRLPYLSCLWKQKGQVKPTSDSSDCQNLSKPHPFTHTILARINFNEVSPIKAHKCILENADNFLLEGWFVNSFLPIPCTSNDAIRIGQRWCHMLET